MAILLQYSEMTELYLLTTSAFSKALTIFLAALVSQLTPANRVAVMAASSAAPMLTPSGGNSSPISEKPTPDATEAPMKLADFLKKMGASMPVSYTHLESGGPGRPGEVEQAFSLLRC